MGLILCSFLIVERSGWNKTLAKLPRVVRHIYTLLVIIFGWVFFRSDTLTSALLFMKGMFSITGRDNENFLYIMDRERWFFLIVGILLSVPYPKINAFFEKNLFGKITQKALLTMIFIIAICYMVGSGYSPFLYYRF